MGTRKLRIALAIGALFVAAACDEHQRLPTAPSAGVTALKISGNTSISDLGGMTQLKATASYSDGTTQDVTAQASWSSGDRLSVPAPGLIRAERYGKDTVVARHGSGLSATAEVRVGPDGAFFATVAVSDNGFATDGARVQVISPAGTFSATTDLWGVVSLPAVGNAVLQVEKAGFRTITKSVTVNSDQIFDLVLQPADGASSTVTR